MYSWLESRLPVLAVWVYRIARPFGSDTPYCIAFVWTAILPFYVEPLVSKSNVEDLH
jgi:hypothetical protein